MTTPAFYNHLRVIQELQTGELAPAPGADRVSAARRRRQEGAGQGREEGSGQEGGSPSEGTKKKASSSNVRAFKRGPPGRVVSAREPALLRGRASGPWPLPSVTHSVRLRGIPFLDGDQSVL